MNTPEPNLMPDRYAAPGIDAVADGRAPFVRRWPGRLMLLLAVLASLVYLFSTYRSYIDYKREIVSDFQTNQQALASLMGADIRRRFDEVMSLIETIDRQAGEAGSADDIEAIFASFHMSRPTVFLQLAAFDGSGEIRVWDPDGPASLDISRADLMRYARASRVEQGPVLSDRYFSASGSSVTAVIMPLGDGGSDPLYLLAEVHFEEFVGQGLRDLLSQQGVCLYLADDRGDVLEIVNPAHDLNQLMRRGNLFDLDEACTSCHKPDDFQDIRRAIDRGVSIQGVVTYPGRIETDRTTIPFRLQDRWITASICSSRESVQLLIGRSYRGLLRGAGLLTFVLVTLGIGFASVDRRRVRAESDALHQRLLAASIQQFQSLAENINVGIFRSTPGEEGRIVYANPAFLRLFGYESQEAVKAIRADEMYADPGKRAEFNRRMLDSGELQDYQIEVKRKDGTVFTVSETVRAIRASSGQILYYEGIIEDITDWLRAQEREEFESRLEATQQLSGKLTHDINNMLTVARANVELAASRSDDGDVVGRLQKARTAHDRMAKYVDRLSDFAGRALREERTVDLSISMDGWRDGLLSEAPPGVTCIFDLSEDPLRVRVDPALLQRMIGYVLENASERLSGAGTVRVSLGEHIQQSPGVDATSRRIRTGAYARLLFQDDGPSPSAEELDRALLPHLATRGVGSGIGLLLPGVAEITRRSGGFIRLFAVPGAGGLGVELLFPLQKVSPGPSDPSSST